MAEFAGGDVTIQSFMKIDHHDDAGLDGDSEQCDVADPYGNAEVEAHHVLKQQPAGHRVYGRKDQHDRFGHRLEEHVEQDKYQKEDDRQDDRQAFSSAQLEFIL